MCRIRSSSYEFCKHLQPLRYAKELKISKPIYVRDHKHESDPVTKAKLLRNIVKALIPILKVSRLLTMPEQSVVTN